MLRDTHGQLFIDFGEDNGKVYREEGFNPSGEIYTLMKVESKTEEEEEKFTGKAKEIFHGAAGDIDDILETIRKEKYTISKMEELIESNTTDIFEKPLDKITRILVPLVLKGGITFFKEKINKLWTTGELQKKFILYLNQGNYSLEDMEEDDTTLFQYFLEGDSAGKKVLQDIENLFLESYQNDETFKAYIDVIRKYREEDIAFNNIQNSLKDTKNTLEQLEKQLRNTSRNKNS
ncbi:MAG: hypothetical protein PHU61_02965 [Candidatus Absconditabacteria bacterium]|nr:hypothetical protein [Candidatus Absconditabacteria bacterium]MDD3868258.1 hypothetical protein [Candidatus Absconditabacteria bacterium]MDD4714614.1 hypothetical protein [Candidatus Absconditabacteria bacterium]